MMDPMAALKKIGGKTAKSKFTYEYSAFYYLNWWLKFDSRFFSVLSDGEASFAQKLLVLQEAARVYRVVRNLEKKYDTKIGLERLAPVLNILAACSAKDFTQKKWIASLEDAHGQISAAYGGVTALSFSTKVLWLRFKRPIIIYDSRARAALCCAQNCGIKAFSDEWRMACRRASIAIDAACRRLPTVAKFSVSGNHVTRKAIAELISHEWFKERVFDSWLWHTGEDAMRAEL
jgi:hypothetical protein